MTKVNSTIDSLKLPGHLADKIRDYVIANEDGLQS
jgi:hypothetical protein